VIRRDLLIKKDCFQKYLANNKIAFFGLLTIIFLSIILGISLREPWTQTFFISDDVDNINIAYNISIGKDFILSYHSLPDWIGKYHLPMPDNIFANDIINRAPETFIHLAGKGPPFYLVLAFVYWVIPVGPENWYFWGSVLNGFLTVCLLFTIFIFTKKYFGPYVAIISTFIISTSTLIVLNSVRVVHYPLLYTFGIAAFLFTEKTKRDYIMFGVFGGLAHLTHPIGIIVPLSYTIYLLIKKEFKGCGLVLLIWFGVLLPWFIRNTILFGGFGYGLYIPYSDKISQFLNLEIFRTGEIGAGIAGQSYDVNIFIVPFQNFAGLFSWEIDHNYHMVVFTFTLFFIIASFISFGGIKKTLIKVYHAQLSKKILIFGISALVLGYYLFLGSNFYALVFKGDYETIFPIQIFTLFIFPPILVFILYKTSRGIFEERIPRIFFIILTFGIISIFAYLGISHLFDRPIPEIKQIFLLFILGLPLAIFGIEKIVNKILLKTNSFHQKKVLYLICALGGILVYNIFVSFMNFERDYFIIILVVFFAIILFTFSYKQKIWRKQILKNTKFLSFLIILLIFANIPLYELKDGHDLWTQAALGNRHVFSAHEEMNLWIRENVTDNLVVASDMPPATWLNAGIRSVALPTGELTENRIEEFEGYLTYFDVAYVITHWKWNAEIFDEKIGEQYYFDKVFFPKELDGLETFYGREYNVFKITSVLEAIYEYPSAFAAKAVYLKKIGNETGAEEIYDDIIKNKLESDIFPLELLKLYREFENYEKLGETTTKIIENEQIKGSRLILELVNIVEKTDFTKHPQILKSIEDSIIKSEKLPPELIFTKASILLSRGLTQESVKAYDSLIDVSKVPKFYEEFSITELEIIALKERTKLMKLDSNFLHVLEKINELKAKRNNAQFSKDYDSAALYNIEILNIDEYNLDAINFQIQLGQLNEDEESVVYYSERGLKILEYMMISSQSSQEKDNVKSKIIELRVSLAKYFQDINEPSEIEKLYWAFVNQYPYEYQIHKEFTKLLENR